MLRRAVIPEAERVERGLLFGGRVRCGTCGRGLRLKHEPWGWIYACYHDETPHEGEPSVNMSTRKLDAWVWELACRAVRDPAFFEQLVKKTDEVAGPAAWAKTHERLLTEAEREYTVNEKRIHHHEDDPEYEDLIARIDADQLGLVKRIAELKRALEADREAVALAEAGKASLVAFRDYATDQRSTIDPKTP